MAAGNDTPTAALNALPVDAETSMVTAAPAELRPTLSAAEASSTAVFCVTVLAIEFAEIVGPGVGDLVVGRTVGDADGVDVGTGVGAEVGTLVGVDVGTLVGTDVDAVVGAAVGSDVVGPAVGASDGAAVGTVVGVVVGAEVGSAVGIDVVGAAVGVVVGLAVGAFVCSARRLHVAEPGGVFCPSAPSVQEVGTMV